MKNSLWAKYEDYIALKETFCELVCDILLDDCKVDWTDVFKRYEEDKPAALLYLKSGNRDGHHSICTFGLYDRDHYYLNSQLLHQQLLTYDEGDYYIEKPMDKYYLSLFKNRVMAQNS